MKSVVLFFLFLSFFALPCASDAGEEAAGVVSTPPGIYHKKPLVPGEEEEFPSPPEPVHLRRPPFRRGGKMPGELPFGQFREELKVLGKEIRENRQLIQSLEEELNVMPPGMERVEVRKKLAEALHRQAELELSLARRRVEIAKKARDVAQERYDDARLELERVTRRIKKEFPDLVSPEQ